MKYGTLVLLVAGMFTAQASYATTINQESTITAVTVFPGAANVERKVLVSLPAGKSQIVVTGLPLSMDSQSLRVSGQSKQAELVLGSVNLEQRINREVILDRERALRDELTGLNLQLTAIDDSITRNEKQLNYIDRLVVAGTEKKPSGYQQLPLEQWGDAWNTLDAAIDRAQTAIRLARVERLDIQKDISQVEAKLAQVASHQTASYVATIEVESVAATDAELTLSHLVSGASWSPVYDADLQAENGMLMLKALGVVSQRTGEDWSNVSMRLSTLRPRAGNQLPPLDSWAIDFFAQEKRLLNRKVELEVAQESAVVDQSRPASLATVGASAPAEPARVMKMRDRQQTLLISEFSAEYQVSEKVSLISGGQQRRLQLQNIELPAAIELATVPRFDPRAMLIAQIENTQESPLLAGSVSLYREGSFIGNSYLPQVLVGEEFKLGFGEDNRVRVKFIPDVDKKSETGVLFGKNKNIERRYQLTIESQHKKSYPIKVFDSVPVASNDDIKVVLTGQAPSEEKVDDKEGVYAWNLTLPTAEPVELNYGYTVSYPQERRLSGL